MEKDENNLRNIKRLAWACRRGMLELDVLLGHYLRDVYADLPIERKSMFVNLLSYPDTELYALLMGQTEANDEDLSQLIKDIRLHAQSHLQS